MNVCNWYQFFLFVFCIVLFCFVCVTLSSLSVAEVFHLTFFIKKNISGAFGLNQYKEVMVFT